MANLQPDRLNREQAAALMAVLQWAVERRPDLAERLLDEWDPLSEAMAKLKATRRVLAE